MNNNFKFKNCLRLIKNMKFVILCFCNCTVSNIHFRKSALKKILTIKYLKLYLKIPVYLRSNGPSSKYNAKVHVLWFNKQYYYIWTFKSLIYKDSLFSFLYFYFFIFFYKEQSKRSSGKVYQVVNIESANIFLLLLKFVRM